MGPLARKGPRSQDNGPWAKRNPVHQDEGEPQHMGTMRRPSVSWRQFALALSRIVLAALGVIHQGEASLSEGSAGPLQPNWLHNTLEATTRFGRRQG